MGVQQTQVHDTSYISIYSSAYLNAHSIKLFLRIAIELVYFHCFVKLFTCMTGSVKLINQL